MGDARQAKRLYQRALEGREKRLGSWNLAILASTRDLAHVYFLLEKSQEALELCQRAYDDYCRLLGPDDTKSMECEEKLKIIREDLASRTIGSNEVEN